MIHQFVSAEPPKRKRDDPPTSPSSSSPSLTTQSAQGSTQSDSSNEPFQLHCSNCGKELGLSQCYPCPAEDYILIINSKDVKDIVNEVAGDKNIEKNAQYIYQHCFNDENNNYIGQVQERSATWIWSVKFDGFDEFLSLLEEKGLRVEELYEEDSRIYNITKN